MKHADRLGTAGKQVGLAGKYISFMLLTWFVVASVFYGSGRSGTFWDSAYLALQLFFANVERSTFQDPANVWDQCLMVLRFIVPWVLPVLGVLAFVKPLRLWLLLKLKRLLPDNGKPLVVVVGLEDEGVAMLRAERMRDPDVDLVAIDEDPANIHIAEAERYGAIVWCGHPQSLADLSLCAWRRPRRIFALTSNNSDNLRVVENARRLFDRPETSETTHRLDVYAQFSDPQEKRNLSWLSTFNADSESFWTHPVNAEEDAAGYLLSRFPVLPTNDVAPRILIVGGGCMGYAVCAEILKHGHFLPRNGKWLKAEIIVVDKDAAQLATFSSLRTIIDYADHEQIGFASLAAESQDAMDWRYDDYVVVSEGRPFTHVFVDLGDDGRNREAARRLAEWNEVLQGAGLQANPSGAIETKARIVALIRGVSVNDRTSVSAKYEAFNLSDVYLAADLQWRDNIRERAVRINECYDQMFGAEHQIISDTAPQEESGWLKVLDSGWVRAMNDDSEISWHTKSQMDRHASREQAKHIDVKLRDLRLYCENLSVQVPASLGELLRDREMLAKLAEVEHRRWNAVQLLAGLVKGDRNKDALTHSDLVPFECLSARKQCYDVGFVYNLPALRGKDGW